MDADEIKQNTFFLFGGTSQLTKFYNVLLKLLLHLTALSNKNCIVFEFDTLMPYFKIAQDITCNFFS